MAWVFNSPLRGRGKLSPLTTSTSVNNCYLYTSVFSRPVQARGIRFPEPGKFFECRIRLPGLFGIQITAQGMQLTSGIRNLNSTFQSQESSNWNLESTARNLESNHDSLGFPCVGWHCALVQIRSFLHFNVKKLLSILYLKSCLNVRWWNLWNYPLTPPLTQR